MEDFNVTKQSREYKLGYDAYEEGIERKGCPFSNKSLKQWRWVKGWVSAREFWSNPSMDYSWDEEMI